MVLGSSGDYGMEVFVGGRIWKEFAPRPGAPQCDAFVESSLFVAGVSYQMETTECDPYGEEFTQSWPVTPCVEINQCRVCTASSPCSLRQRGA